MAEEFRTPPVLYLLYGDDELAIAEFVRRMEEKLGDPDALALNLQRLQAQNVDLRTLEEACCAVPFLASRRMVVVEGADRLRGEERFYELLERIPTSTALVIVVRGDLGKRDPLLRWAQDNAERALVRKFETPRGGAFVRWLLSRCRDLGGEIENEAAQLLSEWVDDDPYLAHQELGKLLDYVDRSRPIAVADVERLTPFQGQHDIFAMVDALGQRDGRRAIGLLHRLLETQHPRYVFTMIVRQFRLLLQAREALESGEDPRQGLGVHPYVAEKVTGQARNFDMLELEKIYHLLSRLDLDSKRGRADLETGMDRLVASLTTL